jgi:hypothetical protein
LSDKRGRNKKEEKRSKEERRRNIRKEEEGCVNFIRQWVCFIRILMGNFHTKLNY